MGVSRRLRGMTLVELLMTILIVAIGMGSLVILFIGGLRTSRLTQEMAIATSILENTLESIRSDAFENLNATNYPSRDLSELPNGRLEIAFSTPSWATDGRLKEVTVSVSWGTRQRRRINATTYIARYD